MDKTKLPGVFRAACNSSDLFEELQAATDFKVGADGNVWVYTPTPKHLVFSDSGEIELREGEVSWLFTRNGTLVNGKAFGVEIPVFLHF